MRRFPSLTTFWGLDAYYIMPHSTSAVLVPIKRQYSVNSCAACARIRDVLGLNPACPVP